MTDTQIVGVFLGALFVLVEALKRKDRKKNGVNGYFSEEDREKLSTLHTQHSLTDGDGRPLWYSDPRGNREQMKKLDGILVLQKDVVSELQKMNGFLGKWVCPYTKEES
ncbi:MAG: hypothetical protein GY896_23025 [Gammaproteobacteria bacterium]|nr:hypothetical protein [Gammaproteobacteria bacterium]